MKELIISANTENLKQVQCFVKRELESANCTETLLNQVSVAVEEIFVNIASYAYNPTINEVPTVKSAPEIGSAIIQVDINDEIIIRFEDRGIPFNPTKKEDPDTNKDLEEREEGGLGIYIVKQTMDDILYRYKSGRNILTIRKKINPGGKEMNPESKITSQEIKSLQEMLTIDSLVYPEHQQATYDEVINRYKVNKNLYILLYYGKKLTGYICLLPIKEPLYSKILLENRLYDSDIPGSCLEEYTPGNSYRLYIISMAIHPGYHGRGLSKHLIKGFYEYLLKHKKDGINFSSVLSTAVTNDGKLMLERMGFTGIKKIDGDFTLFELPLNDELYNNIEKSYNANPIHNSKVEVKIRLD
ncbi:MAG: GNAT family N-acetyltransferase [Defluviitaleaceae bacterium]|nr:GNAT family N-acetyltransferase [Defluviitaleaceae bacterium]